MQALFVKESASAYSRALRQRTPGVLSHARAFTGSKHRPPSNRTPRLPQAALRLHVEWVPSEVTLLPQGHAPFLLAYGNWSATRAEADFSRLPSKVDIAPATLIPPQALGGASRLIAKPAPLPWTRITLWSVLFLAVILLAWMAYGLSKEKTTIP